MARHEIIFQQDALNDLLEIYQHIADDDPDRAAQIVDAIKEATNRLANFPRSGRRNLHIAIYELIVPRLPYIVVYQYSDFHQLNKISPVKILAVRHSARNL